MQVEEVMVVPITTPTQVDDDDPAPCNHALEVARAEIIRHNRMNAELDSIIQRNRQILSSIIQQAQN